MFASMYVTLIVFNFNFRPAPKNEDEMMVAIFEYIDRFVLIKSYSQD